METDFTSITLVSGGFVWDDDGWVIQTKTVQFELENVWEHSCTKVDQIDYLELDMNIWYQIQCEDSEGIISQYSISIPKWLSDDKLVRIPYTEVKGWVLELTPNTATPKKIVYVDMDNVLVDFKSGMARLPQETLAKYGDDIDDAPGIFAMMDPMPGAIDAFNRIAVKYDTYILSTAPWENPLALSDKVIWVKRYLWEVAKKRLIITHHKNLNRGDYLIDDRTRHWASEFQGEHIHFGTDKFPDWASVLAYLDV